jgi:hypothetical protein
MRGGGAAEGDRKGGDLKGYFLFTTNADGEPRYEGPLSSEALQTRLRECGDVEFAETADEDPYTSNKVLVIKGEIVVPEAIKVATLYKIP